MLYNHIWPILFIPKGNPEPLASNGYRGNGFLLSVGTCDTLMFVGVPACSLVHFHLQFREHGRDLKSYLWPRRNHADTLLRGMHRAYALQKDDHLFQMLRTWHKNVSSEMEDCFALVQRRTCFKCPSAILRWMCIIDMIPIDLRIYGLTAYQAQQQAIVTLRIFSDGKLLK